MVYPKDRPVGDRALRVSKILLTIYGIGTSGGGGIQGKMAKNSKIELETQDLVSVYLDSTPTSVQFHKQRPFVLFLV